MPKIVQIVPISDQMAPADVLSELFQTLRLRSDLYFTAQFGEQYSVAIPPQGRCIRFHLVRRGECYVSNEDGSEPVRLRPGDLAIVPNGVGHVLTDNVQITPVPLPQIMSSQTKALQSGILAVGAGEPKTIVLCGFCTFDEDIRHPLFDNIADRMVLCAGKTQSSPSMGTAIRLLGEEAELAAAGTRGILSRSLEIIFMQALRRIMENSATSQPQFLHALADAHLSKALQSIHQQPAFAWTSALLARRAGMSRTRFSIRFTAMVGQAPMAYVTHWRLIRARVMLADTNLSTDEIAHRCGYRSLSSFTRRFKAVFGSGPGAYRRGLHSK